MARIKKILCMALAMVMIFALVSVPSSAAVTTFAEATFDDGAWPATISKTHFSSTIPAGIYGKATTDYSPQAPSGFQAYTDRLFVMNSPVAIPVGGKLKISFDIAAEDFTNDSANLYRNYVSMKLNGSSFKYLLQSNNVSCDTPVTINSNLRKNAWNNITYIFAFNSDNSASEFTMYINGKSVYTNASFNPWAGKGFATWNSISEMRFGGHMLSNKLYFDNVIVETYEADDTILATAFTTSSAAKEGNEKLIDTENKKVALDDIAMTVASFNEKTTGFVVLDENGEVASGDTLIVNANVYAVYTSGINSYYEPYTLSIEPPSISGNTAADEEFIDTDNNEIRIVDIPDITVAEFKEMVSVSDGAVLSITKGGSDAADTDLLADCAVSATLSAGDTVIKETSYAIVTERTYIFEDETLENGTFITREGGNGYAAYTNGDATITAFPQKISGVTFKETTALGTKAADDSSLAIEVSGAGGEAGVFALLADPFISSNKVITTTHTFETKLYIDGLDSTDVTTIIKDGNEIVQGIELVIGNRVALIFKPDGSITTTDGTVVTDLTWKDKEWIPIAVTYHKATNRINVYACGVDTNCSWTPAPIGTDIRFRAWIAEGASFTYAIDDVKLYTDSLEKVRYEVDGVNSTVTMYATDKIPCLPILAVYKNNALSEFVLGKESRTISVDYENGDKVKAMLWKGGSNLKPIADAKTLVDGGAPLTAYDAALSKAFSDGMVLQSGMPITVWGTSGDPDTSTLSVTLGNETKIAYVNGGEWEAGFSAREASAEGETLTVTTANGTQTVNDIVFGDVYFVGGQSNAYLPMKRTNTYAVDKSSFTETDNIRFFHQTGDTKSTVQQNPVSGSTWTIASGSNIANMSAIGMYFAKTLVENNVNVPIGLISIAHNGTSLYAHLPANIVSKYNELGAINNANRGPSMVYNAMIAPVEKFSAKGLLWYQGENDSLKNVVDATTLYYGSMFDDFTDHLKTTTGNNDFKVFAVQLSSHGTDAYPDDAGVGNQTTGWQVARFRAYQYDTLKNKANSYIVPSLDHGWRIGDGASDVAASNGALTITEFVSHPEYKKPIGQRLANAALYSIYNKKTADEALAPMPESITYSGNTVTIKFKNVGTGLGLADGSTLLGFELIEGNTAVSAEAEIQGTDTVVITSDEITAATGVRYAFYHSAPNTVANLVNSYGMPSLTFADDKDGVAAGTAMKTAQISWGAVLENE